MEIRKVYATSNRIGPSVGVSFSLIMAFLRGRSLLHSGMTGNPVLIYASLALVYLITFVPIVWASTRLYASYQSIRPRMDEMLASQSESYPELLRRKAVIETEMRIVGVCVAILGTIMGLTSAALDTWIKGATENLVMFIPSEFCATWCWILLVISWPYLLFEEAFVIPLLRKFIELKSIDIRIQSLYGINSQ